MTSATQRQPHLAKSSPVTPTSVLVVLHEGSLGGAGLSLLRLLPLLEQRGWRFAFWAPADDREGSAMRWLRERDYKVEGAPRRVFTSIRGLRLEPGPRRRVASLRPYFRTLRQYAAEVNPDLIHFNSITTLVEALSLRPMRRASILHVHEMVPDGPKGRVASGLARSLASEVVAVSESCADRLASPGYRPRVVYESAPVPDAPRPDPPCTPLIVGSVGVISRRKGSDIFVEAARLVSELRPEISFELIGAPSDPLDAAWADQVLAGAVAAGMTHRLRADVGAAMRGWHVFALPSRRDPFPIAMLEAMGLGIPCVGSSVDGIVEQLAGEAGLLVPGDDPATLAAAILQLADDDQMRRRLGEAGRARVLERYTPERQAEGIDAAYGAALGRPEAPE